MFDAAVNFIRTYNPTASKNKNNFRGMTRSQIEGDLVIEDKTGILIAGSATAKETIKNKSISFDGTGCSLKADLLNCEFNGNGDTRLIGTMTGGTFSGGILESQSTINGSVISNSLIKGTVANASASPSSNPPSIVIEKSLDIVEASFMIYYAPFFGNVKSIEVKYE